jgi:hypothetical protein
MACIRHEYSAAALAVGAVSVSASAKSSGEDDNNQPFGFYIVVSCVDVPFVPILPLALLSFAHLHCRSCIDRRKIWRVSLRRST